MNWSYVFTLIAALSVGMQARSGFLEYRKLDACAREWNVHHCIEVPTPVRSLLPAPETAREARS